MLRAPFLKNPLRNQSAFRLHQHALLSFHLLHRFEDSKLGIPSFDSITVPSRQILKLRGLNNRLPCQTTPRRVLEVLCGRLIDPICRVSLVCVR